MTSCLKKKKYLIKYHYSNFVSLQKTEEKRMKELELFGKMKKKSDNKGFTLVELIVVLVILAILAAILVPALLGYIDRAKNQQAVLNAKSVLTATQAELSSMYAKDEAVNATTIANHVTSIADTADVPSTAKYSFSVQGTTGHAAWTVKCVKYSEKGDGTDTIIFDGKTWDKNNTFSGTEITIK